jgi:hypothetical protein
MFWTSVAGIDPLWDELSLKKYGRELLGVSDGSPF